MKKKLSYYENYIFFESLYELTKSGIPILKAFDIINLKEKKILEEIKSKLEQGDGLSSAIDDTGLFSSTAISIVKTGEITGNLEICFEKLYKYYERMNDLKKNLQSSLFYPLILVISILFLLLFINYYFIPQISSMYEVSKLEGSFASLIIRFSMFSNMYKIETIVLIISVIIAVQFILSDIFKDNNKEISIFNLPFIENLLKNYSISDITWSYFLMLSSGIDIVQATDLLILQAKNKKLKSQLSIFGENIKLGNSITDSLQKTDVKDEDLFYFVNIGEETGNLDKNLKIVSEMYSKKLSKDINYLVQIVQPSLIIIITVIVGALMSGLVLPMLDYSRFM